MMLLGACRGSRCRMLNAAAPLQGEFMGNKNASDQSSWKVFFRDAVFELEPYRLREKLKAAQGNRGSSCENKFEWCS
jgi:hypothetical protein